MSCTISAKTEEELITAFNAADVLATLTVRFVLYIISTQKLCVYSSPANYLQSVSMLVRCQGMSHRHQACISAAR